MANPIDVQQELLSLVRAQQNTGASRAGLPASVVRPAAIDAPGSPPAPAVDGQSADAVTQLSRELEALRRQLSVAEETAKRQSDILDQNTRAVLDSNAGSGSGLGSLAREVASSARNTGALSALTSPLAGLVSWIFRRGNGSSDEPALPQVSLPPAIDATLGLSSTNGLAPISYGADGVPRVTPAAPATTAANITIQVQAMDSRSFLDNSDQIARAVREAMLNSHAINDVIGEM